MGAGESPLQVASTWLESYGALLVGESAPLEVEVSGPYRLSQGRGQVLHYRQRLLGYPVENAPARVVTKTLGGIERVVYVAGQLARLDPRGLRPIRVSSQDALNSLRGRPVFRQFTRWTEPTLVVLKESDTPGPDDRSAILAYKISASGVSGSRTFFVAAFDGELVYERNETHSVDISGQVNAFQTPGVLPDTPANGPVLLPLQGARVEAGNVATLTDENGDYSLSPTGPSADVSVSLVNPWVTITTLVSPLVSASEDDVTSVANFTLNASPSQFTTAQVNAFVHVQNAHDFYQEFAPDFTPIDVSIETNVNINDSCNAFFDSFFISLNFLTSGSGCTNSAFSSIVLHEYGHFIVNRLGLAQGAFGEGFSDVLAMYFLDDPIVGRGFFGSNSFVRNPPLSNVQFPCSSPSVHFCGMVLGGSFWNVRENLKNRYGDAEGQERANQLWVDWSLITLGGIGTNSAHPGTVIETLIVDDNDGFFGNGTPNLVEICAAFDDHSIPCPVEGGVAIRPVDLPEVFTPDQETTVEVELTPITAAPLAASAELFVRVGNGPFESQPITIINNSLLEVTFPALPCLSRLEYYLSVQDTTGATSFFPAGGDTNPIVTFTASEVERTLADDFELPSGWTVGGPNDSATSGIWLRANPVGTAAQPEDDQTENGSLCFFTGQGAPGGPLGANDVDGGQTTLTSPGFDVDADREARIEFWLWYSNDTGNAPDQDILLVEISGQDGAPGSWVTALTIGPDSIETSGGWFRYQFWVSDFTIPTDSVRVRFIAQDTSPGSLVEAAIDDFAVDETVCVVEPTFTRGDCNLDGVRNIADALFFLGEFFQGSGQFNCADACDNNDDGALDIADAVTLLNFLFVTDDPLPQPLSCGTDPTDDGLGCDQTSCP